MHDRYLQSSDNAVAGITELSRHQLLLTMSPAVIYACRPDGDYGATFISDNVRFQLGYEPSDFTNDPQFWADRIHEDDKGRILSGLNKLFEQGFHNHEYRFLHSDGSYRWMRDDLRLLRSPEGAPTEIIGSWSDITERKKIEEELRRSKESLEEAQKIAGLGNWEWDIATGAVKCTKEVFCLFRVSDQEFTPTYSNFMQLIHPEDRTIVMEALSQTLSTGCPYNVDYRLTDVAEGVRHINGRGRVFFDEHGSAVRMAGTVQNITERKNSELALKEKEACLQTLLHHDPLTGLANRALCRDRLERAVQRSARDKKQLALMFVDLDQFKRINDILGHHTGDKLLKAVAKRIQSQLRMSDSISRFGGDEFVILVDDFNSIEQVATIAQKILDGFTTPLDVDGRAHYVTASIGIAIHSPEEEIDGALIRIMKRADVAMFAAKEQGRNNFLFYSAEMDAQAHEYLMLENDLRQALEREQFVMHYQPQIELTTGQIIGLEALIRWQHPEKGLLTPGGFIPIAETSGLMASIGAWALRTACAYAQKLVSNGRAPLRMSINISPLQFKAANFTELVSKILAETGFDPQCLELEITEGIAMEHTEETISRLSALREMGVKLAIDDFGKGYSSLSYLKHLPVTTLKIDMAFVRGILTNQYDSAIIEAILTLAKSLDMDVIAEGIENEEQRQALRSLGCELGQGYLFSHPIPPEELNKLLSTR